MEAVYTLLLFSFYLKEIEMLMKRLEIIPKVVKCISYN